jgi:hypothetical protein
MDLEYETLPKSDLVKFKKKMPISEETLKIAKAILALPENQMGHFKIKDGTKAASLKVKILRAGESLGKKVVVRRSGNNDVLFWVEEEPKEKTSKKK